MRKLIDDTSAIATTNFPNFDNSLSKNYTGKSTENLNEKALEFN